MARDRIVSSNPTDIENILEVRILFSLLMYNLLTISYKSAVVPTSIQPGTFTALQPNSSRVYKPFCSAPCHWTSGSSPLCLWKSLAIWTGSHVCTPQVLVERSHGVSWRTCCVAEEMQTESKGSERYQRGWHCPGGEGYVEGERCKGLFDPGVAVGRDEGIYISTLKIHQLN